MLSVKLTVISFMIMIFHLHYLTMVSYLEVRQLFCVQWFLFLLGLCGVVNLKYKNYIVALVTSITMLMVSNYILVGFLLKDWTSTDWVGRLVDLMFLKYVIVYLFRHKTLDDIIVLDIK
jgi:hypothetical protein